MKFTAPTAIPTPKITPAKVSLGRAFPKGEHQAAHNDGNQGQPGGDWAGEGGLQRLNGLRPGRTAALLGENLIRQS